MTATTSRRSLLATLPASLALVPLAATLPATVAAGTIPQPWRDLIRQCGYLHRQGHLAAIRAYLAGLDLDDFSCFTICERPDGSRGAPVLIFGSWGLGEAYDMVTPDTVGRYTPAPGYGRWPERQKPGKP
jgi:hypothetical protein